MSIDHGHLDILAAQELQNGPDFIAAFQEMSEKEYRNVVFVQQLMNGGFARLKVLRR